MSKLNAPAHLQPETRVWWASVVSSYHLEPHHNRLLVLACEAWDRCAQAREQIEREGLTIQSREGAKAHPCVAVERDARNSFARLLGQLGLDAADAPKRGPGRPVQPLGVTWQQLHGVDEPGKKGRRPRRKWQALA